MKYDGKRMIECDNHDENIIFKLCFKLWRCPEHLLFIKLKILSQKFEKLSKKTLLASIYFMLCYAGNNVDIFNRHFNNE